MLEKTQSITTNSTEDDNPIQHAKETFITLQGITKQYQFAVKNEGFVYARKRSCWCLQCMQSMMDGTLNWGNSSHEVVGCNERSIAECVTLLATNEVIVNDESVNDVLTSDMYSFYTYECTKTSGPGVQAQTMMKAKNRNDHASKLSVGEWVLFAGDNDDEEPIWLGRVMSNTNWEGQGVKQNNQTRKVVHSSGVEISRGEVAVFVMWYEKINIMSDKLDYHVSRTNTEPIVQNSKYLIPFDFEVHRVIGESNPVPRLRTSTRKNQQEQDQAYACPRLNNQRSRDEDWHDKEFGLVWKMDRKVRETALTLCHQ